MPDQVRHDVGTLNPQFQNKMDSNDLFYEQQGKKVSLFIINPTDLSFDLAGERSYLLQDQVHDVNIWEEGRVIYALVK
jgi:hypothetical protein